MTPHRPRITRSTVLLAVLALIPLTGACSADPDDTSPKRRTASPASSVPAAAPANIEKIAALTGCTADVRTDADELREGVCVTPQGDWIVTTFPAEKFKQSWLEAASVYGGTYLVGPRWAIGGKVELLEQLRTKVGGNLQKLRDMNAPPVASPSPSA